MLLALLVSVVVARAQSFGPSIESGYNNGFRPQVPIIAAPAGSQIPANPAQSGSIGSDPAILAAASAIARQDTDPQIQSILQASTSPNPSSGTPANSSPNMVSILGPSASPSSNVGQASTTPILQPATTSAPRTGFMLPSQSAFSGLSALRDLLPRGLSALASALGGQILGAGQSLLSSVSSGLSASPRLTVVRGGTVFPISDPLKLSVADGRVLCSVVMDDMQRLQAIAAIQQSRVTPTFNNGLPFGYSPLAIAQSQLSANRERTTDAKDEEDKVRTKVEAVLRTSFSGLVGTLSPAGIDPSLIPGATAASPPSLSSSLISGVGGARMLPITISGGQTFAFNEGLNRHVCGTDMRGAIVIAESIR
ncbi:hypothetical protein PYCC9005_005226 [Savitreella phatthalungensis]